MENGGVLATVRSSGTMIVRRKACAQYLLSLSLSLNFCHYCYLYSSQTGTPLAGWLYYYDDDKLTSGTFIDLLIIVVTRWKNCNPSTKVATRCYPGTTLRCLSLNCLFSRWWWEKRRDLPRFMTHTYIPRAWHDTAINFIRHIHTILRFITRVTK